jgi:hypothetical protein
MVHTDMELADLVARDLELHLRDLEPTAFAVALWVDEGIDSEIPLYGVSVGADADLAGLRAAPAVRDIPDEHWLHWPSSERWNSGSWTRIAEDFLSPDTEDALEPLRDVIQLEELSLEHDACDLGWPCSCQTDSARRWIDIGVAALRRATVAGEVLVFGEGVEMTCPQRALAMLRTVDPGRFHATFPAWRELAAAVRGGTPTDDLLAACELQRDDVTSTSVELQRAMRVADTR